MAQGANHFYYFSSAYGNGNFKGNIYIVRNRKSGEYYAVGLKNTKSKKNPLYTSTVIGSGLTHQSYSSLIKELTEAQKSGFLVDENGEPAKVNTQSFFDVALEPWDTSLDQSGLPQLHRGRKVINLSPLALAHGLDSVEFVNRCKPETQSELTAKTDKALIEAAKYCREIGTGGDPARKLDPIYSVTLPDDWRGKEKLNPEEIRFIRELVGERMFFENTGLERQAFERPEKYNSGLKKSFSLFVNQEISQGIRSEKETDQLLDSLPDLTKGVCVHYASLALSLSDPNRNPIFSAQFNSKTGLWDVTIKKKLIDHENLSILKSEHYVPKLTELLQKRNPQQFKSSYFLFEPLIKNSVQRLIRKIEEKNSLFFDLELPLKAELKPKDANPFFRLNGEEPDDRENRVTNSGTPSLTLAACFIEHVLTEAEERLKVHELEEKSSLTFEQIESLSDKRWISQGLVHFLEYREDATQYTQEEIQACNKFENEYKILSYNEETLDNGQFERCAVTGLADDCVEATVVSKELLQRAEKRQKTDYLVSLLNDNNQRVFEMICKAYESREEVKGNSRLVETFKERLSEQLFIGQERKAKVFSAEKDLIVKQPLKQNIDFER